MGLEVNNGVSERELLLYFECAEVRKMVAGWFVTVGKERERYIYPLGPNGHLNHRWPLGRKRKGIYTPSPQRHFTQEVRRDEVHGLKVE